MISLLKHTRKADIIFFRSGRIEVKRRLALIMGLRKGDVLNVKTDGCRMYLYLSSVAVWSNGAHEAVCSPSAPGSRHFRAQSAALSRQVAARAGKGAETKAGFYAGDPLLDAAYGVYVPLFPIQD